MAAQSGNVIRFFTDLPSAVFNELSIDANWSARFSRRSSPHPQDLSSSQLHLECLATTTTTCITWVQLFELDLALLYALGNCWCRRPDATVLQPFIGGLK